jgi:hypothetical protein
VADVVTVSVEVSGLVASKTSGLGLNEYVTPEGKFVILRVAVQAETGLMLTLTEYVAELPAGTGLGVCAPTVGALRPALPDVTLKGVLIAEVSPLLVAVKV